jgi:hypothetical protein
MPKFKMPTQSTLLVPIHLDAICVNETNENSFAKSTLQGLKGLPYHGDGKQSQVAAVSKQFHSPPFSSGSLGHGVHLHWALPDALTHGRHVYQLSDEAYNEMYCLGIPQNEKKNEVIDRLKASDIDSKKLFENEKELEAALSKILTEPQRAAFQGLIFEAMGRFVFPEVPNRWLLTRIISKKDGSEPQLKSWVIESDFITTESANTSRTQVPSPHGLSDHPPSRYMGRARELQTVDDWKEDEEAKRYPNLTALGYGEISFSAYYQNCATVFGYHDTPAKLKKDGFKPDDMQLSYSVVGWHSDISSDPLQQDKKGKEALAELAWGVNIPDDVDLKRSVYHGMLHHVKWKEDSVDYRPEKSDKKLELAIGNTQGEALAAYLAQHSSLELKNKGRGVSAETLIEALQLDLLEEIHLADGDFEQLEHAVHEQSFRAHPGGSEWIIRKIPRHLMEEKKPTHSLIKKPIRVILTHQCLIQNLPMILVNSIKISKTMISYVLKHGRVVGNFSLIGISIC